MRVCVWVCMRAYVCLWCVHVCVFVCEMHVLMCWCTYPSGGQKRMLGVPFHLSLSYSLRWSLSLNLKLETLVIRAERQTPRIYPCWGYRCVNDHSRPFHEWCGSRLRLSGLYNKSSYPFSCLPSPKLIFYMLRVLYKLILKDRILYSCVYKVIC